MVQRAPLEKVEGTMANGIQAHTAPELSTTVFRLAPRSEPCPIELYELQSQPTYLPETEEEDEPEENVCSALAAGRKANAEAKKERTAEEESEDPTVNPSEKPTLAHTSLLELKRSPVDDEEAEQLETDSLDDEDLQHDIAESGFLQEENAEENAEEEGDEETAPSSPHNGPLSEEQADESSPHNGPLSFDPTSRPGRFEEEKSGGSEETLNEQQQELVTKTLNTTDQIHGVDPMLAFIAQEMAASALTAGRDAVKPAEETHRQLDLESISTMSQGDDQVDKFMSIVSGLGGQLEGRDAEVHRLNDSYTSTSGFLSWSMEEVRTADSFVVVDQVRKLKAQWSFVAGVGSKKSRIALDTKVPTPVVQGVAQGALYLLSDKRFYETESSVQVIAASEAVVGLAFRAVDKRNFYLAALEIGKPRGRFCLYRVVDNAMDLLMATPVVVGPGVYSVGASG
ncbi:MAG: hypothetical protein KVP17_000524 [Porospora cf. gigantea B]|uniref:uncharacterized protein n=1 Tax=Porospora cf. gigantea B TaxID=2853592 RepID=UPI003571A5C4|nr:MAG: hypothetical protein KVP17_000524 [Porospora cf. gigantea B]